MKASGGIAIKSKHDLALRRGIGLEFAKCHFLLLILAVLDSLPVSPGHAQNKAPLLLELSVV